jgi:hypothetical protein
VDESSQDFTPRGVVGLGFREVENADWKQIRCGTVVLPTDFHEIIKQENHMV